MCLTLPPRAAAKFLTSKDFLGAAARLDGVPLDDFTKSGYRSPTTDWLYHPSDGPWEDVSRRFAEGVRGDVHVVLPNAEPGRVFGATELLRILANEQITTLDDCPRAMLHLHAYVRQQRCRRQIFRHLKNAEARRGLGFRATRSSSIEPTYPAKFHGGPDAVRQ